MLLMLLSACVQECEDECAEVLDRRAVVMETCGVVADAVDVPCNATTLDRERCVVGCLEAAECTVVNGEDLLDTYAWDRQSEFMGCVRACPPVTE